MLGKACFTGDLILGEGSTIVGPRDTGGSLLDYMRSLERLQELDLEVLYPGHGPEVDDPQAKIAEYIEHRSMRERRLVAALDRGNARARLSSPRSGTTSRRSSVARPQSPWRRTWRSSRTRGAFPRICATDHREPAPGMNLAWVWI